MDVAVVGHVEWVEFARVDHVPRPGEIVHSLERWEEAAGGGAVAAVQLARLNGGAHFFTSLGDDELGRRAREQLEGQGVAVHSASVGEPQRRAFTHVDGDGERTITVLGAKLLPFGENAELPWELLGRCHAVFFVSGDVAALRAARRARVLVATARELPTLVRSAVELDALVASATDAGERYEAGDLDPPPRMFVATSGPLGGWAQPGGPFAAADPPGPIEDTYGAGDCFAAGLTYALGRGDEPRDALALAAQCGATVIAGRGPYGRQLRLVT